MVAQDTTSGLEHYGADCDHSGTLHVGTGVPQRQYLVEAEGKAETLTLLTTRGAYAYDCALQCLIREGERYQGQGHAETYDERIAVHLVGAVLPVGVLRETNYYGESSPDRLRRAEANWRRCYDLIAGEPPNDYAISDRVEDDLLTTIDCGDAVTRNPALRQDRYRGIVRIDDGPHVSGGIALGSGSQTRFGQPLQRTSAQRVFSLPRRS